MKVIVTEWKKVDGDWFKKEKVFSGDHSLRDFEEYLDQAKTKKVQATFYLEQPVVE